MHNAEQTECDLRFVVLGPVKVWRGREDLKVGARQQKALLAALLLRDGRAVTAEGLIDDIWGEAPPLRAKAALRTYASGLRKALGADAHLLVSESGGYAIRRQATQATQAAFDVDTVAALAADAERARRAHDHDRARKLYREALQQWDGEALSHIPGPFAEAQRNRLQEWRLGLYEDRLDADLRMGGHLHAVAELASLTAAHPLRERLRELLMLALYRSGRQAEALAVYEDTRGLLAENLGIDPGPELKRLHQRILTSDPDLAWVAPVGAAAATAADKAADAPPGTPPPATCPLLRRPAVPRQLPAPPALFTGRGPELAQLSSALAPPNEQSAADGVRAAINAVGGTGGVGKTCLVLRWAHDHRDRFPDGQLYVNLRGFDPSAPPVTPAAALLSFLDALGVDPAAVPADLDSRIGLYRSLVEGKRMLVVLDNARDTAQVTPLLPGSDTCSVLVTSRSRLAGLVTEHAAGTLDVGVLSDSEAHELLSRRLGPARVAAEHEAVTEILRRCGGLPLALSIVAARAAAQPDFPLELLADELARSADRLDALNAGEVTADLRAVFATSYRALEPEAAHAFCLLGQAPGRDIGVHAAASLFGVTLPRTRALLRTLETAHLMRQHMPGRYQFHDLVHLFALQCSCEDQDDDTRVAALRRLGDFYLHSARHAASQLVAPCAAHVAQLALAPPAPGCRPHRCEGAAAAREWFETEAACLRAAQQKALENGWYTYTWQLAAVMLQFHYLHGRCDELDTWHRALEAAGELRDPLARAAAHYAVGKVSVHAKRHAQAHAHLQKALALFEETGNLSGQADTLLAFGCSLAGQGAFRKSLAYSERGLQLFRTTGDLRWEAASLNAVGMRHAVLGDYANARRCCEEARVKARSAGDAAREAFALDGLGFIAHRRGHHRQALACYRQALNMFRNTGYTWGEPMVLQHLGEAYLAVDQVAAARRVWRQALDHEDAQFRCVDAAHLRDRLDALESGTQKIPEGVK